MSTMLNIGRSGAQAFQSKIDATAQNIANTNTAGYKRGTVNFKDLLYTAPRIPSVNGEVTDYAQGGGVRGEFVSMDFSQGTLISGQSDTTYAVSGKGYFGVFNEATQQIELTRDGAFGLNLQGQLVDAQGNRVMTQQTVTASGDFQEQPLLYLPNQTAQMTYLSDNRYGVELGNIVTSETNPELFGSIQENTIEGSNVDMASEMTDLMVAQRAYNMNLKAIQTADETWQTINQLR